MDIRKYLSTLIEKSLYPTLKNMTEGLASRIEKAIKDKEYETVNPNDISQPIVEAQNEVTKAIKELKIPEPIPTDLSVLEGKIDRLIEVLTKKELTVNVGKTEVNVDNKSVVDFLKKIYSKIPELKPQEVIDYTLMFDEMMKIMEKPHYTLEMMRITDLLQKISEKQNFSLPEELITKNGIKVIGLQNHSLGRSLAYETVWQKNVAGTKINPATEEKQDAIITALGDLDVTVNASDIEIGAIEIKNSTDDTRATVGANGLYVDVRNQQSSIPTHFNGTVGTTPATTITPASNTKTILLENTHATQNILVSLDAGSNWKTLRPYGVLSLECAVASFQVKGSGAATSYEGIYTT